MATVSGGDKVAEVLRSLGDRLNKATEVRVGWLEGVDYPDGTPVAAVAALNNFGAPAAGIPPRPFFTNMVAEKSPEWAGQFATALKASDNDTSRALNGMGETIVSQLLEAIIADPGPPNSPVTDLLKQRFPMREGMTFADVLKARRDVAKGKTSPAGKPLVWSGFMMRTIGKEVR